MLRLLIETALLIVVYMSLFFVLGQIKKNNGIVDVAWGGGFVLIVLYNLLRSTSPMPRQVLVTILVAVWGLRLAIHLYNRNWAKPEDFRYRKMREKWGKKATSRAFWFVYMFQGLLMLLVSYPLIMAHAMPGGSLATLDFAGVAVWIIGFLFEIVSDAQLKRFVRREKKGADDIMTGGLWRYSRHPNYFGEVLLWWGLFLILLSIPHGWAAVGSPLLVTFLLVKVSGVPLLEKRYADNAAYQAYARKTSVFIPWFPKK